MQDHTIDGTFKGVHRHMDTKAPFTAVRGCPYACHVPYIPKPYVG